MDIDLFNSVALKRLMNQAHAAAATATYTETGIDLKGYSGRAIAIVMIEINATATSADTVAVTLEKCTAANGTGAVTIATATVRAGDGASAQEFEEQLAVPISGYGGIGTTHRYLRAKAVVTDANSNGGYVIAVAIALPGKRYKPDNTG